MSLKREELSVEMIEKEFKELEFSKRKLMTLMKMYEEVPALFNASLKLYSRNEFYRQINQAISQGNSVALSTYLGSIILELPYKH